MSEQDLNKEIKETVTAPEIPTEKKDIPTRGAVGFQSPRRPQRERRARPAYDRPKPEFDQKIISIRRVTRVVAGGRRMSFSVALVIGDRKGSVGLGTGKAVDTALAINKAFRSAKKNLLKVKTTKEMSIPHSLDAKFSSSQIILKPNRGRGTVAGSSVRDVLVLGGIKNVTSKVLSRSKNQLNNARAAIKALSSIAVIERNIPVVLVETEMPAVEVAIDPIKESIE